MAFEWSEAKRLKVLAERGLDFADATVLFDGRPMLRAPSPRDDEDRRIGIGELNGRLTAVVWVERGERIRIITKRSARDGEKRRYQALFG